MSVPNRSEDGIDDPLSYAPRWVSRSQPSGPNTCAIDGARDHQDVRGGAPDHQRAPDGAWDRRSQHRSAAAEVTSF